MTEKKLRELEALMATKDILSPKEVGELWDLEIAARSKYLKEYKDEIARLDSKLPGYGLIYHSKGGVFSENGGHYWCRKPYKT